jgi:Mn2+/Fe2+ NRAMP family transporter
LFYGTYVVVAGVACLVVLTPGLPLVPVLVLSQVLNAVLLLPLLLFMFGLSRDRSLMGEYTASRAASSVYLVTIAFIALCIGALFLLLLL